MKKINEIVIVSGKGGTGKTSLTAALASLFTGKVMVDCDVDAANLHLILNPEKVVRQSDFAGGKKADIDPELCTKCGICLDACRFEAISPDFVIDPFMCEGCGACFALCPHCAVNITEGTAGTWYVTDTGNNERFVYAEMHPGEDNSGKLVSAVRNEARIEAKSADIGLVIIDGPPGIGCPVISSVTGTKLVIVITEPTPAGVHDLERIVGLANHFKIKTAVVVNKFDINPGLLNKIKDYCSLNNLDFIGEIPFDSAVTEAQRAGKSIVDYKSECGASIAIKDIFKRIELIIGDM
ncbi:MAG: ATP-binding protein [Spirochaetes bacterium]|nr:ATP-binding protein [Spirochaetota bacterium]